VFEKVDPGPACRRRFDRKNLITSASARDHLEPYIQVRKVQPPSKITERG